MKEVIFTYCHYMGWGDSMISIHDILNCAQFLRLKCPDLHLSLIIIDIRNNEVEKILENILDFNFFTNFFNDFKVIVTSFEEFNNYGCLTQDNENFIRIYSGRNDVLTNNTPGIFDVYCNVKKLKEIEKLRIPFQNFTYDDDEINVDKFPIFNNKILERVENFISENFNSEFSSVCYRSQSSSINYENLNFVKGQLETKFDISKQYFLCSNSSECKLILKECGINFKLFRDVDNHSKNHILDGMSVGEQKIYDSICSVCEMIILSKSNKIYYSGEMGWISYFTWYGRNVEKKELILINNI